MCITGMIYASFTVLLSVAMQADVESGPTAGDSVPAISIIVVGERTREVEYSRERKGKPTVYVFIQAAKFDRPIARFLRDLDAVVKKESDQAEVAAIWLTDDKDKTREYLPVAQQSLRLANTVLAYFPGEPNGPEKWNINLEAHATVVLTSKSKVVASRGYRSMNEREVGRIREILKKSVD